MSVAFQRAACYHPRETPCDGITRSLRSVQLMRVSRAVMVLVCVTLPCLVFARPGEAEPPAYPDKANLLIWRDAEGKEHPVRTAADWAKRRQHILANIQRVMGPLPGPERKVPLDVKVTEEVKGTGWV